MKETGNKITEKNLKEYYKRKTIDISENAVKVLERRYLKRDEEGMLLETPKDMFVRVAHNIAMAEKNYVEDEEEILSIEKDFFDMMSDLDFLPNSPTLMNAGKELQQLAACFVLPVGDSMEKIFEALKDTALIQKSGGGVGYSFSKIRPKNDVVLSTKGVSSGPISFMTVFNAATDTIKQGGTRRGANMGILRIDHPDILDFIKAKEDNSKLTNFNISVGVTETFMKAVENDDEYEVINPRTKQVVDRYNAREVFKKIVKHAWKNGDPGIIFLDRLNKDNPTPNVGTIESTNPCVAADTLISTDRGLIKASVLHDIIQRGEEIKIVFDKRALDYKISDKIPRPSLSLLSSSSISSFDRGLKEVFKLKTYSGYELTATGDHKILTIDGYKQLKDLSDKDFVLIQPYGAFKADSRSFDHKRIEKLNNLTKRETLNLPRTWTAELGEILGWLTGDGWIRKDRVGFTFGRDDDMLVMYFSDILNKWNNYEVKAIKRDNGTTHLSYHSKGFIEFFKGLGINTVGSVKKEVPSALFNAPKEAVSGFLRGIFSADGSIDEVDGTIKLSSSSERLLKGIQILLLNLGVKSNILERQYSFSRDFKYVNKAGSTKTYRAKTKKYFELFINGGVSKRIFKGEIGFIVDKKRDRLENFSFNKISKDNFFNKFIDKVDKVSSAGRQNVYDFNEPVSNSFIGNGIVVKNCGEQPLLPYEACNLGSINLSRMIMEEDGVYSIDYKKLKKTVHTAVRFLDDVIDMSKYPLDKISDMVQKNRKIGLGIMGWADILIRLGIPYNSEEAIDLAKEVMGFIQDESKEASKRLAVKRGSFANIKGSIYDSPDGYEIRNATTTTIAPTGTLSIIANCSSGIEPIFAVSFVKNVMDEDKLLEVNPYFEEIAKKEGFYSKDLMEEIAEKGSLSDVGEIPNIYKRVFVTAHEVTPVWHTRMQAAFQEFVDNAVSKTVNFPTPATEKDVEEVYMLAYRLGCKGITIYRDGSREGQVLQVSKKKEGSLKKGSKTSSKPEKGKQQIPAAGHSGMIKPRPRPEITQGVTKKYSIGGCGKLYVTVNSDEHGICEIFTNTGEEGCAALSEAVSRLISITIRSGVELESIQKQVSGIRCITCIADNKTHVLSCPDAIGKSIEYYIKGTNKFDMDVAGGPKSVMICPEEGCGGIMEPEGGCYVCRNCGFSKCS